LALRQKLFQYKYILLYMSDIVIRVEELGKMYKLGEIGTGSLRQDLQRWWARVRGKEDPFTKIEETNDRAAKGSKDYFWALKDISFEVCHGEVLGIIGSNGAGKSTLLKILSKITAPTKGNVRLKGRIASLLEVGTGFHPDLTGRENIFLNGAILGMTRAEIKSKFDEIVDFAGVERFIDTPVKRYSSGMYVRLAFAVAAFLEPEILIVDEVLAVGDAEFQKKCLGRMKYVSSKEGRTVLFVSHNIQAVNSLCSRVAWFQKGQIQQCGNTQEVTNKYLSVGQQKLWKQEWNILETAPGNEHIKVLSVELLPHLVEPAAPFDIRSPMTVRFRFINFVDQQNLMICLHLFTAAGECVFDVCGTPGIYNKGEMEGEWFVPGNLLNDGSYYFSIVFVKDTTQTLFYLEECLHFELEDYRENMAYYEKWWGYFRPQLPFKLTPSIRVTGLSAGKL
jgi:lipopolysaccharide transport system ATP-binding protein